MLPSENWSSIVLSNKGELEYTYGEKVYGFQRNLYILSDEEINKGDWVVFRANGRVDGEWILDQARADGQVYKIQRKIIATTDAELNEVNDENKVDESWFRPIIPKIPKHIIKAYVKKPFDKVLVEYWDKPMSWMKHEPNHYQKLNPDGTLAVSLVEEKMIPINKVADALEFFGNTLRSHVLGVRNVPKIEREDAEDFLKEWIKENL